MLRPMDESGFDTLKATRALEAAGFESAQAEAMVTVLGGTIAANVATKWHIRDLKDEIGALQTHFDAKLERQIGALQTHFDAKLEQQIGPSKPVSTPSSSSRSAPCKPVSMPSSSSRSAAFGPSSGARSSKSG